MKEIEERKRKNEGKLEVKKRKGRKVMRREIERKKKERKRIKKM